MTTENAIATLSADDSTSMMLMPPHVAAAVPFDDHERWSRLTFEQRMRVSQLLLWFGEMATVPEGIVKAANRIAALNGHSGSNLVRLFYAFKARGWTALAKIYKGPAKLPDEFVQEVRRRILANKRGARAALQSLRDDWADGKEVDGYGTWRAWYAVRHPERDMPERFPGVYPQGWSQSNLYTKQPIRAQQKLARQGFAAMKRYIPHVIRDTSQLRPQELITIDDFELDFLIRAFNPVRKRWEICRCAGLLAIDVATRRKLAVALIPRFKLSRRERALADQQTAAHADLVEGEGETTEEKKTRVSICRHDVQSLLHVVFSTHGRPADYGTTILCERGGAAITDSFERALELLLGVQVARTGLISEKTLRNGFVQGGGKPWEKGWIESLFNLLWNRAGAMAGQKGSTWEKKPADHEAKVAYAEKLFSLDGLPTDVATDLRVPFLTIDQALDGLNAIFERIERRTDHTMIGFEERFQYRLPDGSALVDERSLGLLPPEEVLKCEPVPYRECPLERWDRLIKDVRRVKVADYVLACMLLTPMRVTLSGLKLTFTHARVGYTYSDADSPVMKLPEGSELLGFFEPSRPGTLHVTDLEGRYVGSVRRRGPVDIRDYAAIGEEAGEIARLVRSCVVKPVRALASAEDAQLLADREHNTALLQAHGIADPTASPAGPATKPMQATAGAGAKPVQPALSRRLQAPARDAFKAYQGELAHGIAAEVAQQQAVQARHAEVKRQGEALTAEELQALSNAPAAPLPPADPGDISMKDFM